MLKQLQKLKNQKDGFTIIEVLIVLAIAGLIMVVVFLAVPNLQRTQRNNARKTDANNLLSNLAEYVGNAGGQLPTAGCTGTACTWAATVANNKLGQFTAANVQYYPSTSGMPTLSNSTDKAYLVGQAKCNGPSVAPSASTNTRDYVVYYNVEGSTVTNCTSGN